MEEGRNEYEANDGRGETSVVVGGVGEVPAPPAPGNETGEGEDKGEGGASEELITAMEDMEVGTESKEEGDEVDAEEDGAEVEGGGIWGGAVGTGSHRVPNPGCGSRRHNPC